MTEKLNTQPYKGSRDFYPDDMRVRNFIFNTWKKVCKSYGYEEYDGPFIESFDIFKAKSGEELVNEQLYSFTDRGDRKVAIRPEMTPTLARMISQKINELPRPIRWFSISNFWRYEKPQRGRGREFFQLNTDIFGVGGIEADLEIISIMYDLMKRFGAKEEMFQIRVNNRRFMDDVYKSLNLNPDQIKITNKAIDKKSKITREEFEKWLNDDAKLDDKQIEFMTAFLKNPQPLLNELARKGSKGAIELNKITELIKGRDMEQAVKIDPSTIRGLDYYTGTVFEIFDLNPQNIRAIAGGGRYDDLVSLFVDDKLTGTGFAMGDITLQDFLTSWNLLPQFEKDVDYIVTLWPSENPKFLQTTIKISSMLREKGNNVITWLENNVKIDKQLKYADKRGAKFAVLIGENEINNNTVTIKDMLNKTQEEIPVSKLQNQ